jgi:hypothetical protein
MKIEFDNNIMYDIKDAVMVQFLKDDLKTIQENYAVNWVHPDDVKYNKKLVKAYKTILDYYGVTDD